ncbi:hypothetical protein Taro_012161 [Colocasia esculenta]|uniref:E3 ubiquitin-protein ligase synoviolin-like TPR repeats domain-containing protein n=1 Tax=Colocasia esculenta TaxID=4460 RepID=A0A843UC51_COLES|nr:hypothetical protein [Colocasia esculenta]
MEQYLEEKKASQKRSAPLFQWQDRKKAAYQSPQRLVIRRKPAYFIGSELGVGIGNTDSKAGVANAEVGIGNVGFGVGIANAGSKDGIGVPQTRRDSSEVWPRRIWGPLSWSSANSHPISTLAVQLEDQLIDCRGIPLRPVPPCVSLSLSLSPPKTQQGDRRGRRGEAQGCRRLPPLAEEMMRLGTYAGLSFLGAIAVIYHAFNSREQFYPAMVYLSTSKISLVLLLNMGLVIMCIMWQLVKCFFLGSLREAEVERLNEQSWREVMEILFAITIFRQDFSVGFLAMVTALLLIKALHWLAQKRVEYIETTPTVSMLSHVRIVSFMGFLLLLDCLFLYSSLQPLIQTWQASVALFFSFEYMILATTTISTFIKYAFYVSDMLMEGQWERKAVYTFYLELIRDLLHLSMYLFFFMVIFIR